MAPKPKSPTAQRRASTATTSTEPPTGIVTLPANHNLAPPGNDTGAGPAPPHPALAAFVEDLAHLAARLYLDGRLTDPEGEP